MDGEKRNIFPGGITHWANEGIMFTNMSSDAWEMKGMCTFSCVNGSSLTCLHAVQTDTTATPELEAVTEKRELERGTRRGRIGG